MHGAPLHIGPLEVIGIADLSRPDYGDAVPVGAGELVPLHRGFDGLPERSFRLPEATARRISLLRIDRHGWRADCLVGSRNRGNTTLDESPADRSVHVSCTTQVMGGLAPKDCVKFTFRNSLF